MSIEKEKLFGYNNVVCIFLRVVKGETVKILNFKKVLCLVFTFSLGAALLCGCGQDKNRKTKISIDKNGGVVNTIYEEFTQDYYDVSELSDMASEEISYYNSEYVSPKISLTEVTKLEEEPYVRLKMTFESASDYSHFNQTSLFFGTVAEAVEKGYELSAALVNNEGQKIDLGSNDFHEKHIVITTEKTIIETPYAIEYMSDGVFLKDKKEADLTNVLTDSVQLLLSK